MRKSVDVEYIESGTFQGGEEDCFSVKIEFGQTCVVVKKSRMRTLLKAMKYASREWKFLVMSKALSGYTFKDFLKDV